MRFASFCLLIASLVVSPVANSQTTAGDVSFDDSTTTVLQGPTVQDALEDAVLMGCDEAQVRDVLEQLVRDIVNPYPQK